MNDTVRAYDLDAGAYAEAGAQLPDSVRADIEDFVARLGVGARVLEIGSGGGRSTHGAISSPRHFTYWRADALRQAVFESGWADVDVRSGIDGKRSEHWLELAAVRT